MRHFGLSTNQTGTQGGGRSAEFSRFGSGFFPVWEDRGSCSPVPDADRSKGGKTPHCTAAHAGDQSETADVPPEPRRSARNCTQPAAETVLATKPSKDFWAQDQTQRTSKRGLGGCFSPSSSCPRSPGTHRPLADALGKWLVWAPCGSHHTSQPAALRHGATLSPRVLSPSTPVGVLGKQGLVPGG